MYKEKVKALIKSHYGMIRRLEKLIDLEQVKLKKPICEATKIIDIVNSVFETDCREKSRRKRVVYGRHSASYFLRVHTKMTLEEIAEATGNTDHSTVVNSIKVFHNLNSTDEEYSEKVKKIQLILEKK
jgi:chromosomal replication initiation ATPase DnaA